VGIAKDGVDAAACHHSDAMRSDANVGFLLLFFLAFLLRFALRQPKRFSESFFLSFPSSFSFSFSTKPTITRRTLLYAFNVHD
jgi:hypothetical protein